VRTFREIEGDHDEQKLTFYEKRVNLWATEKIYEGKTVRGGDQPIGLLQLRLHRGQIGQCVSHMNVLSG